LTVANKPKSSDDTAPAALPFEEAMQRLETIVDAMESGDVPLAELLAKFEEGSRLLAACEQRLKAAELKIEQLKRRGKDASPLLENFSVPTTTDESSSG
jgi:exodeoxyribonuclease VII small subunit